jgi:hypothetical protein
MSAESSSAACSSEQGVFLGWHPLNAILSTLGAFLAAGVRPPTPLARAIMVVLVTKLVAIAGIAVFLASDGRRPVVDPIAVSRPIGPSAPAEGGH